MTTKNQNVKPLRPADVRVGMYAEGIGDDCINGRIVEVSKHGMFVENDRPKEGKPRIVGVTWEENVAVQVEPEEDETAAQPAAHTATPAGYLIRSPANAGGGMFDDQGIVACDRDGDLSVGVGYRNLFRSVMDAVLWAKDLKLGDDWEVVPVYPGLAMPGSATVPSDTTIEDSVAHPPSAPAPAEGERRITREELLLTLADDLRAIENIRYRMAEVGTVFALKDSDNAEERCMELSGYVTLAMQEVAEEAKGDAWPFDEAACRDMSTAA